MPAPAGSPSLGVVEHPRGDEGPSGSLASIPDAENPIPPWLDPISVVVAVVLAAASTWGVAPEGRVPVAILSAIAAAPIARVWSRTWPWAWSLLTIGALAVINIGGPHWDWLHVNAASQLSLLLGVWIVLVDAVVLPWRPALATATGLCAVVVGSGVVISFDATLVWIPGILLALLGGQLLHSLAWSIVRAREAESTLARQALAIEQRRIAREVHDVVAHSLSVTALQLTAARMAAEQGDLAATRAALDDADRLTRASLADLRRTVRLLREAGAAGDQAERAHDVPAALPGLADVAELAGSFRAAGLAVAVHADVPAGAADPLIELVAYRVVQEALTNATRHQADPRVEVTLTVRDEALVVEVTSQGERRGADGGGHGLVGMRERVEAVRGRLQAGPSPEGWRVAAALPLDGEPDGPDGAPQVRWDTLLA